MQTVETTTSSPNSTNAVLCAGILDVLRNDWGNRCGEFEAYWFGYEALKDALHENLIYVDIATIKVAMKELAKQNKVELRPTYNDEWVLCGRGWFACT
jgi:hypothetical protein